MNDFDHDADISCNGRLAGRQGNLAWPLRVARLVQGRITEKHLDQAEETFPGIGEMYDSMPVKPPTFLQLVWLYEEAVADELVRMGYRSTVAIG